MGDWLSVSSYENADEWNQASREAEALRLLAVIANDLHRLVEASQRSVAQKRPEPADVTAGVEDVKAGELRALQAAALAYREASEELADAVAAERLVGALDDEHVARERVLAAQLCFEDADARLDTLLTTPPAEEPAP